jgi:alkylation response protein AidB-like acyl-CoA dehydrogenase
MHFALTDEQAMIAETAQAFFAENATSERTRAAMADKGCDHVLWSAFAQELGFAGMTLPEEHGGAGLGLVEFATLAEAAGSVVAALPLLASCAMAAPAILAGGSDEQRTRWLPGLASGKKVGTVAIDVDGRGPRLEGRRLVGTASHVPHGAVADLIVVATREGAFAVPVDAAGVRVTALTTMDLTRPLARIDFDEVAAEPLHDPAAARDAALIGAWIALAADALGGAQAALDRTVAYARERIQFGRPIGSFQAYKHRLADMMVEIEQARSAVYWAACATDERDKDRLLAAHAAKAVAAEAYQMCAGNMIQLHGGIGFTWEHDAHLFFKRARANASLLGSPHWHRERIAQLIGLDTTLGEAA